MRNYELIKAIYHRCPKLENFTESHRNQLSIDQLFDRCLDVVDLIERERPQLKRESHHPDQQEAGMDY